MTHLKEISCLICLLVHMSMLRISHVTHQHLKTAFALINRYNICQLWLMVIASSYLLNCLLLEDNFNQNS